MRKLMLLLIAVLLCSFTYAVEINQTVLWDADFDEDSARTGAETNIVTDYIDGSGEMMFLACDLSSIPSGSTINSAHLEFYSTASTSEAIDIWKYDDNSVNGSQVDDICPGAYCSDLNNNLNTKALTWTGGGVDDVWNKVGANESGIASIIQTSINAGDQNVTFAFNSTDTGGADYISARSLEFGSLEPRCFIDYTEGSDHNVQYKFTQDLDPIALDTSGSGNNGTITGASWTSDGKVGPGMSFDGNGDKISTSPITEISNIITISLWAKISKYVANTRLISNANPAPPYQGFEIRTAGNKFGFWGGGSSWLNAVSTINLNEWYYITTTCDNNTKNTSIYINGIYEASLLQDCKLYYSDDINIGARANEDYYFNGTIDEVNIWSRVLNETEILDLYGEGKDKFYVDPENVGGSCSDSYSRGENSESNPWCSLQTALDNLAEGDTIFLRDGNHSQVGDPAGSSQVGGFELTDPHTWTEGFTITSYPGETATLTSHIDACGLGTWTLSSGIWTVAYGGYNEYMRYYLRNTTTGQKWEMLAYDNDAGDMDSWIDMADPSNPYGCFADDTTDDYIECRLPSWANPNTCGEVYVSNSTAVLFFDNQDGAERIIANVTIESGRSGIYTTDGANLTINNVEIFGGEFGIRQARFDGLKVMYSHLLQDYYDDSSMAWDDHRKGETAESSSIFTDDDPTNTNITHNRIQGWFNGILAYNNDGDCGFSGLDVGYNNFTEIYDDVGEGEGDGCPSRWHHNLINDSFVGFSFHPYDDPTHSTIVDHNIYYNPKYNYFYKGGASYYGEAVKMASTSDYTLGVNFSHNDFLGGNGIKANTGQTHTQYNNNWVDNIFYSDIAGTYLITKSGLESDGVFYDNNLYYSITNYFRYYGSDSISTTYNSLASAIASWRLPSSNLNSIDADPLLGSDFIPPAGSPVCGAGTGGSDIGALPCSTTPPQVTVTITSPANNSVTAEEYPVIEWETNRESNCTLLRYIEGESPFGLFLLNYYYNVPANTTRTYIVNIPSMQVVVPDMTFFNIKVKCTHQYTQTDQKILNIYVDTAEPVPSINYPVSSTNIKKTSGEQWIELDASCYDQTLEDASISITNSSGSWYWSDNQTGLSATNTTSYTWTDNVSMSSWPVGKYTVNVSCLDGGSDLTSTWTSYDFQTNITVYLNDSNTGALLSNFSLFTDDYNATANGTSAILWVDANASVYITGNMTDYVVVPQNVSVDYSNLTITMTGLIAGTLLQFYDEQSGEPLIGEWIEMELVGAIGANYSTNTSSQLINALDEGLYFAIYGNDDYYKRSFPVVINDTGVKAVKLYCLETNESGLVSFYIKDVEDQFIENISIMFMRLVQGTWRTVIHRYTDFAGSTQVNLDPFARYYMVITDPSGAYQTKSAYVEPVFSSYTVFLDESTKTNYTTVWDSVNYNIGIKNGTLDKKSTNFTLTVVSGISNIDYFGLSSWINGTFYSQNISGSPSGGIAYIDLPLNEVVNQNANVSYFIKTTNPHLIVTELTYSILNYATMTGNHSLIPNMALLRGEVSERSRIIIGELIAVLMAILGQILIPWKKYGPLAGIPILAILGAPMIGWIPLWLVAFQSILMVGIVTVWGDY